MDRIEAMRLFVRLAERRSFSAAAGDLKIKQSTASKWIAELERLAGSSLVDRTTRALRLNAQGQRFLAHCHRVLGAFEEMQNELAERNPAPHGRVRISAPVVFGLRHVVEPVAEFLRKHPAVEIELRLDDRYVNLVEEGFDLAVRVGVPTDTSARGLKLADSRRLLVAAPSYLKAHGRPTTPKQLADHECLLHGELSSAVWRFGRGGGRLLPISVHGRASANNSEAVLRMARSGLGLALLADWLIEQDLAAATLVPLLETFTTPPAPVYALTPAGRYSSPTVRLLVEALREALRLPRPARNRS
jgi:DNA-binding transcriptional LysR family regulator